MATDPKYGRRDFFKDSVLSVAKAAKEYAAHVDAAPEKLAAPVRTDWLRPPGAVGEALFLERCTKCSDCVKACPHDSIVFHIDGTPVIFPDQVPCYLCEDTPCIAACVTEALLPVAGTEEVRMGMAVVNHRLVAFALRDDGLARARMKAFLDRPIAHEFLEELLPGAGG